MNCLDEIPIELAAKMAGMLSSTIRQWERRYGWPQPRRSTNGYRVYSRGLIEDIRQVRLMAKNGTPIRTIIVDGMPKWPAKRETPTFTAFKLLPMLASSAQANEYARRTMNAVMIRHPASLLHLLHQAPIQLRPDEREIAAWLPALIGCAEWQRVGRPMKREPEIHDAVHANTTPEHWDHLWIRAAFLMKGKR